MAMRFAAIAIASVLATAGTYVVMGPLQGNAETSRQRRAQGRLRFRYDNGHQRTLEGHLRRGKPRPDASALHQLSSGDPQPDARGRQASARAVDDRQQQLGGPAGSCMQRLPWRGEPSDRRKPHEIHPGQRTLAIGPGEHGLARADGQRNMPAGEGHEPQRQSLARGSHKTYGRGSPRRLGLASGRWTNPPARIAGDICRVDRRLGQDRCRLPRLINRARPAPNKTVILPKWN